MVKSLALRRILRYGEMALQLDQLFVHFRQSWLDHDEEGFVPVKINYLHCFQSTVHCVTLPKLLNFVLNFMRCSQFDRENVYIFTEPRSKQGQWCNG